MEQATLDVGVDRTAAVGASERCSLALHRAAGHLESLQTAMGRFVPRQLLDLIGVADAAQAQLGDHVDVKATIVFADLRNFTQLSENQQSSETFRMLNTLFEALEAPIVGHRGVVDKFLGDGLMILYATPEDAVASALAMLLRLRAFNLERAARGEVPLALGIGVNTGITSVGILGTPERQETTVIGDAVNVASRVQGLTRWLGCDLLISESTHMHLGPASLARCRFADRVLVKGRRRPVSVYEVYDADLAALGEAKDRTRDWFDRATTLYHLGQRQRAAALFDACATAAPGDEVVQSYLRRIAQRSVGEGEQPEQATLDGGAFLWLPEYDTGHFEIDAQHHELVRRYELLHGAVAQRDRGEIKKVLEFLKVYAAAHFHMEESMMRSSGYPLSAQHVHEHGLYLRALAQLEGLFLDPATDPEVLRFKIETFLQDWLVVHSTKVDKHFAVYLRFSGRAGGEHDLL